MDEGDEATTTPTPIQPLDCITGEGGSGVGRVKLCFLDAGYFDGVTIEEVVEFG